MARGFGNALISAITSLGVVRGEIDNAVEAALRDIGDEIVGILQVDWPEGDRSKPWQQGIHSADLWKLRQILKLAFEIHNSADYAVFVHHESKFGGPPGLADRVVPDLVRQVEADPLAFVTQRVFDLLGGP